MFARSTQKGGRGWVTGFVTDRGINRQSEHQHLTPAQHSIFLESNTCTAAHTISEVTCQQGKWWHLKHLDVKTVYEKVLTRMKN